MAQEPRHLSRAARSPVLAVVLALAVRTQAQEVLAVAVTVAGNNGTVNSGSGGGNVMAVRAAAES